MRIPRPLNGRTPNPARLVEGSFGDLPYSVLRNSISAVFSASDSVVP